MRRDKIWTRKKVTVTGIDIFASFYCSSSSFLKKVKLPIRFGRENQEPNPPHIYPRKLLIKEVLTLHQSF